MGITQIIINFLIDVLFAGDALIGILIINAENIVLPHLKTWCVAFIPTI